VVSYQQSDQRRALAFAQKCVNHQVLRVKSGAAKTGSYKASKYGVWRQQL